MVKFLLRMYVDYIKGGVSAFVNGTFYGAIVRAARPHFQGWANAAVAGGPPAIAQAVAARVRYHPDPWGGILDFVAAPELTFARQYGDCDDFAYLTAELLRQAGMEAWLITYFYWNVKDAHVVVVYRSTSGFGFIDQGILRSGYKTLPDAVEAAAPGPKPVATVARRYGDRTDIFGKWVINANEPRGQLYAGVSKAP